jgi:hypothetical protein
VMHRAFAPPSELAKSIMRVVMRKKIRDRLGVTASSIALHRECLVSPFRTRFARGRTEVGVWCFVLSPSLGADRDRASLSHSANNRSPRARARSCALVFLSRQGRARAAGDGAVVQGAGWWVLLSALG